MSFSDEVQEKLNSILNEKINDYIGLSKPELQKQVSKLIQERLQESFQKQAERNYTETLNNKSKTLTDFRTGEEVFCNNQIDKWKDCFDLFELMYILSAKTASEYCKQIGLLENKEELVPPYMFITQRELHGRACQIFSEILCLMKNGYADAALARWRTLYEISIISDFIKTEGENVAKSFYLSNSHDYNWAKVAKSFRNFKYKNITFKNIQDKSSINKEWLKEYTTACQVIHASAEGTFGRLSNKCDGIDIIPVGKSDYGIDISGMHSCIWLSIINATFLTLVPLEDALVNLKTLMLIKEDIINCFVKTKKEIFNPSTKPKIEVF